MTLLLKVFNAEGLLQHLVQQLPGGGLLQAGGLRRRPPAGEEAHQYCRQPTHPHQGALETGK